MKGRGAERKRGAEAPPPRLRSGRGRPCCARQSSPPFSGACPSCPPGTSKDCAGGRGRGGPAGEAGGARGPLPRSNRRRPMPRRHPRLQPPPSQPPPPAAAPPTPRPDASRADGRGIPPGMGRPRGWRRRAGRCRAPQARRRGRGWRPMGRGEGGGVGAGAPGAGAGGRGGRRGAPGGPGHPGGAAYHPGPPCAADSPWLPLPGFSLRRARPLPPPRACRGRFFAESLGRGSCRGGGRGKPVGRERDGAGREGGKPLTAGRGGGGPGWEGGRCLCPAVTSMEEGQCRAG